MTEAPNEMEGQAVIGDRGPLWAKPTLAELIEVFFDGGTEAVYDRLAGADDLCPDCLRGLVVELVRQHAADALNAEFAELGS